MQERLNAIIEYRTDGNRTEFAELVGWSRPYLSKLLRGEGWGIAPVLRLVERFPTLNARWLLTGEGTMQNRPRRVSNNVSNRVSNRVK